MATTINFPDNPSIDDTYVYQDVTYKFDGTRWFVFSVSLVDWDDVSNKPTAFPPTDNSVNTDKLDVRYKNEIAMPALDVVFSSGQVFRKTLLTNSTLTFSNLHIGVKDLEITGDFILGLPTWLDIVFGEYDGTVVNLIEVKITSIGSVTEVGWCSISQNIV